MVEAGHARGAQAEATAAVPARDDGVAGEDADKQMGIKRVGDLLKGQRVLLDMG